MKAVFRKECRHQLLSFKSIFFVLLFIVLGISLEQLFSAVSIDIGGMDNKTYAGSFYVIIKLAVSFHLFFLIVALTGKWKINRLVWLSVKYPELNILLENISQISCFGLYALF